MKRDAAPNHAAAATPILWPPGYRRRPGPCHKQNGSGDKGRGAEEKEVQELEKEQEDQPVPKPWHFLLYRNSCCPEKRKKNKELSKYQTTMRARERGYPS